MARTLSASLDALSVLFCLAETSLALTHSEHGDTQACLGMLHSVTPLDVALAAADMVSKAFHAMKAVLGKVIEVH